MQRSLAEGDRGRARLGGQRATLANRANQTNSRSRSIGNRAGLALLACATVLAGGAGAAATTPKPAPADLFALVRPDDARISRLLASPRIDGISLQLGWGEVEVADGTYRWQALDNTIDAASTARKRVTLHILPLPQPPQWLEQAGARMYDAPDRSGRPQRLPVPWDPIYLARFSSFVRQVAHHLTATGRSKLVAAVSVAAPVPEMSLYPCDRGSLVPGIAYDRSAYLAAWEQMIGAYAAAFPSARKFISAPVEWICRPDSDQRFYRQIIGYARARYGKAFWMFATDLTANGSSRLKPYRDLVGPVSLAYQTIWSATGDPTHRLEGTYPRNLEQAVCRGLADGARYFELYPADLLSSNPNLQAAARAVHTPALCA